MQIETTMRYHYTPTRMAIIKKTITSLARMWRTGTFIYCWWACKTEQLLENSVAVSSKAKHKLTIQPSNPILRYLFKRNENICPYQALYVNAPSNIIQNSPRAQNNPNVHQLWMDEPNVYPFDRSVLRNGKARTSQKPWMNLKTPHEVIEVRRNRLHVVWSHLHKTSWKGTLIETECRSAVILGCEWEQGLAKNGGITRMMGLPGSSVGQESACSAGDPGSIPGWAWSPEEGDGNPHQYSCLENPVERRATVQGVTKSQTRLSDFTFFSFLYLSTLVRGLKRERLEDLGQGSLGKRHVDDWMGMGTRDEDLFITWPTTQKALNRWMAWPATSTRLISCPRAGTRDTWAEWPWGPCMVPTAWFPLNKADLAAATMPGPGRGIATGSLITRGWWSRPYGQTRS